MCYDSSWKQLATVPSKIAQFSWDAQGYRKPTGDKGCLPESCFFLHISLLVLLFELSGLWFCAGETHTSPFLGNFGFRCPIIIHGKGLLLLCCSCWSSVLIMSHCKRWVSLILVSFYQYGVKAQTGQQWFLRCYCLPIGIGLVFLITKVKGHCPLSCHCSQPMTLTENPHISVLSDMLSHTVSWPRR